MAQKQEEEVAGTQKDDPQVKKPDDPSASGSGPGGKDDPFRRGDMKSDR